MGDLGVLLWVACGAIGGVAANVRGWNVVVGILAGLLLGPLALLLFFVGGIIAAGGKTCPECAEKIKAAAKVCRFCRAMV
ncbi:MAG: hypothetical protein EBR82_27395 [Caulobacteraceae bacterium]|nr:hypothetical protein [Caulobacteraceae bacterium]